jgi:hypothetical protein
VADLGNLPGLADVEKAVSGRRMARWRASSPAARGIAPVSVGKALEARRGRDSARGSMRSTT